jgi:hypothetical protein
VKMRFSLVLLCGVLGGSGQVLAEMASPVSVAPHPTPPAQGLLVAPAEAPPLSPGLDEIVKLTKAATPERDILSFVRRSKCAYHVTSEDIIQLGRLGVSKKVTTALIRRGNEIRAVKLEQQARIAEADGSSKSKAASARAAVTGFPDNRPITVRMTPLQPTRDYEVPDFLPSPQYLYPGNYYPRYSYSAYHSFHPRDSFGLYFGGHYRHRF